MCADVPLRPWHFGRNTVRDRHGVSLSDLVCLSAPHARNMVWQRILLRDEKSSSTHSRM
jgi:hypothetical protein